MSVEEPRLSTTTDEAGRQIRAGLELWVDKDDDYPLRGTGEVLAGSTLELGALRLDVAFFALAHRRAHGDRALRRAAPRVIKAVVSDFGGVITLPLIEGFKRAHAELGIPIEALGKAMALTASRAPEPPLWTLERGQMTEPDFIAGLAAALSEVLGRPVDLDGYGARLMGELEANDELLAYYRALRERGVRLAILTNNVREWHDALADEVRDRRAVRARRRLRLRGHPQAGAGDLRAARSRASACPARRARSSTTSRSTSRPRARAGMHAIHFRETAQVIAELDALVLAA